MDRKLIYKMAAGCLGQYGFDGSLIKPGSREFEELYRRIEEKKNEDAETDLHEIVEDAVYEFVTGSPYF
ncbi:YqzH family protein [Bacillus infantis]|uniref:YqzH family protein n=1 Tax=Bacillus infantis TaxID=324767 RepID=UPI0039819FA7